jgi:hypothetical protein
MTNQRKVFSPSRLPRCHHPPPLARIAAARSSGPQGESVKETRGLHTPVSDALLPQLLVKLTRTKSIPSRNTINEGGLYEGKMLQAT